MLNQQRVQSGFDAEILLGAGQLTYALLGLVDAGRIPTSIAVGEVMLGLRGPAQIDRTYEPHPDAPYPSALDALQPFAVEILFDHASGGDVRVHLVLDVGGLPVEGDLFIALRLRATHDPLHGLLEKAALQVEVTDLHSDLLPFIESQYFVTKAEILANVKAQVDREVDLASFGAFKRLHDFNLRKLEATDEHAAAFGVYANLRLQNGPRPDDLLAARGDINAALNFLPEGADLAMASREGLFGDMARDAFEQYAHIDEDGDVSHPWHKKLKDPTSEKIGKIKGVSVGPSAMIPNALRIDVHVEYQVDNWFDPDGHMVITLTPGINAQGVMVWNADASFHASLALELIGLLVLASLFTGIGAIAGLGLGAAIAGGVMTGMLVDGLGHMIVDELYSGRVEKKVVAALPDVICGRVEVAQRRWDPLYTSHHAVAMRPDGALINNNGVALWGRAALDRQAVPVAHCVVRDKRTALPGPPTHLRYRVYDEDQFRADFIAIAPGTERRDFSQHDPINEPTLFELSLEQIQARLKEKRIVPDLAYVAKRVDVRQHQVHSIQLISQREINETRGGLIYTFENETRALIDAERGEAIREQVRVEFEEAGVEPTAEQFDARVAEVIEELLAPLTQSYIDGPLGVQLEVALVPLLRFDLPPEHLATLQHRKIMHLLDFELITMRKGLMYYRDQADGYKPDNLLRRPRYRAAPVQQA